jgi:maleylpyruvate isomerase
VILYSYWRSSSAWRVRIVLNLKSIAYEYRPINIAPAASQQRSEAYGVVNAMRQVPTLEWHEAGTSVRLTQSVAIAEYLDERYPEPRLLPGEPLLRARVREAVESVNAGIQPFQNTNVLAELRQSAGEAAAQRWAGRVISDGLAALEQRAQRHAGRFLVGDALSLADVFLTPQLYNARRYGVEVSAFPRLLAVEAEAASLPAFARARPEVQPDAVTS